MPFRIYNDSALAVQPAPADNRQARPEAGDFDILVAGFGATGVVTGCTVTAQGTPDMTVAVAGGSVRSSGVYLTVTAGNATIGAAHASLPRVDLVVVTSAGALATRAGTAHASCPAPVLTAGDVALAAILIPANDTTIGTTQITDKRVALDASPSLGTYNVMNYGAIGDGASHPLSERFATLGAAQVVYAHAIATTDNIDWAAIQAACDAVPAAGGIVFLPAGTFVIDQIIRLKAGVRLRGAGQFLTTIKVDASWTPKRYDATGWPNWIGGGSDPDRGYGASMVVGKSDGVSNITIADLTLDHNVVTTTTWAPAGTGSPLGNSHTIDFRYGGTNVLIENVRIRNVARYAINFLLYDDIVVRGCDILTAQLGNTGFVYTSTGVPSGWIEQDGIHFNNVRRVRCTDNLVNTTGNAANNGYQSGGDDAIAVLNFASGNESSDILIQGNVISSAQAGVGLYQQDGYSCVNVSVTDNIFVKTVLAAVRLGHYGSGTPTPVPLKNITIANNLIRSPLDYQTTGIGDMGVIHVVANVTSTIDAIDGLIVSGNQINGSGMATASGQVWYVVFVARGSNVTIVDNACNNWIGSNGLQVYPGPLNKARIAGNRLDLSSGPSALNGMWIRGATNCTIDGNIIDGKATGGTGIHLEGVDPSFQALYNNVIGNRLRSFTTGYAEAGSGTAPYFGNLWLGNNTQSCTTPSSVPAGTTTINVEMGTGAFTVSDPISASNLDDNGIYYPKSGMSIGTASPATATHNTAYFVYLGKAKKAYTNASIRYNITTAPTGAATYAEVGIFKGTIATLGTAPALTRVATAAMAAVTTGLKLTSVTLTGVLPGDDLWAVLGVQYATVAMILTGTDADTLSTAVTLSQATYRPSTGTSPVTPATVQVATIPGMVVRLT